MCTDACFGTKAGLRSAGKPNPYANPEERGGVVESLAGLKYVAFVCFGTKAGLRSFFGILEREHGSPIHMRTQKSSEPF